MNQENEWNLDNWNNCIKINIYSIQINYNGEETVQKLRKLPGILNFDDINNFKNKMIKVSMEDKFELYLGDSAEVYYEYREERRKEKFRFYDEQNINNEEYGLKIKCISNWKNLLIICKTQNIIIRKRWNIKLQRRFNKFIKQKQKGFEITFKCKLFKKGH
ncbi:unnamed protein product [Paramecium pentaurelia]|uniref:Uncharacterized protein n=1 Tax=Paramecium pentaurelia TaxID=43138 RepID=A0A8S1S138_9CILI|nr:unnamed protein product [Paramecium pentaurelia]